MKTSVKYLTAMIAVVLVAAAVCGVLAAVMIGKMKDQENHTFAQVAAAVRTRYPKVEEQELVRLLNGLQNAETEENFLQSYGIGSYNWAVEENHRTSGILVVSCIAVTVIGGLALLGLWGLYARRQKKETAALTKYLSELNRGNYQLLPEKNTEDDNSLLYNEIYKTTVCLRQQKELAQNAKDSLKEALSDISHQLKTPLTSVGIMLDNLLDNEDMPKKIRRDFLRDMRSAADHIGVLVQSLLKLSSLDADSVTFRRERVNLSELMEDAAAQVEVLADLKGVQLLCQCEKDASLSCDPTWSGEALTNIVKNCVEHTDAGGTVTLTAEENKLYSRIEIRDTGCGIPPEELPHIFERFYKGKNAGENSVGIGLALAKAIVEKQGGSLRVESRPGKGSTFILQFSRRQAAAPLIH